MKKKTHIKLNISLPRELHTWLVRRQKDEQKKTRIAVVPLSRIIAECVDKMMVEERNASLILNEEKTEPLPHTGATARIVVPSSETSGGGSSTRRGVNYRTVGKAK